MADDKISSNISNKTYFLVSKEKDKRKKSKLNPVAKNAGKFNRASVFKDKTKYDRKKKKNED